MKSVIEATLTNLYYLIAGLAIYFIVSAELWLPAIFAGLLCFASGFHHWNIGARWVDTDISRRADYAGMYGVIYSFLFWFIGFNNIFLVLVFVAITLWIADSSRIVIGVGIAALFSLLFFRLGIDGLEPFLQLSFVMSVAFVFNYLGDEWHSDHHSFIHGLGWHVGTSYGIFLFAKFLA